jgi:hypothetical protein
MQFKKNHKVKLKGEYWKVINVLKDYVFLESLNSLEGNKRKYIMLGRKEFEKEVV